MAEFMTRLGLIPQLMGITLTSSTNSSTTTTTTTASSAPTVTFTQFTVTAAAAAVHDAAAQHHADGGGAMRARGREIYIITAVVAVVLIVAWYFLLFSPTQSKLSDLDQQVQSAQSALSVAQQEVVKLESYKKTAPQSRAEIVRLGKMLPESEDVPGLIIELTKTAEASGVAVTSITRGTTTAGSPYGIQTLTLQVSGRYFDVEDFLYRLEEYVAFRNASFRVTGRLLQVTHAHDAGRRPPTTSTSGSPPLAVTIGLNAYLWGGVAQARRRGSGGRWRCAMSNNRRVLTYVAIALIVGAALALAVAMSNSGADTVRRHALPRPATRLRPPSTRTAPRPARSPRPIPPKSSRCSTSSRARIRSSRSRRRARPPRPRRAPAPPRTPRRRALSAKVKVDGTSYNVMQGDKVPGGSAAEFTITAITSGDVTFKVIDGSLENGDKSFSVNLGEAVRVTLESGVSYDISVVAIGAATSGDSGSGGTSHSITVLSITSQNGVAVVTFEVDGKTYADKTQGAVIVTSWGEIEVIAINVNAQTVTIMHGDQTLTLHAGQVIVK